MATETTFIQFQEGSVPATPAATKWRVYAKTSGLFVVDDAGIETGPFGAAGAGGASDALKQRANAGLLTYTTGRYYGPSGATTVSLGTVVAADVLVFVPFYVPSGHTFDRICINVTTAQASGSARLGIYESAASGLAGALLLDAGTVDCSTTGSKEITISQALTTDTTYHLAMVLNNGSIAMSRHSTGGWVSALGSTSSSGTEAPVVTQAHTFGVLPDPAVPVDFAFSGPRITLRAA